MQFLAWLQTMPSPWGMICLVGGAVLLVVCVIFLCGKAFSREEKKTNLAEAEPWQQLEGEALQAFLSQQPFPAIFPCCISILEKGTDWQKQVVCDYGKEKQLLKLYLQKLGAEGYPASYAIALWPYCKEDDFYFLLLDKFRLKCSLDEQLAAKEFFAAVRENEALPYLLQGVVQPEKYVLSRIAEALIPLGSVAGRALGDLLSLVCPQTALGILAILEQMPGNFPLQPVYDCLQSEEWTIRMAAIHVLAKNKNAAGQIVAALNDKQWQVRAAAVKALGEMQCYPAKEKISQMQNDESKGVRIAVEKAIQKLGEKS